MANKIIQVIGCAYTYNISRAVRNNLSKSRKDHSSHKGKDAFSYFRKVDNVDDIVNENQSLKLRKHPFTGEEVNHWYEPELAILLGKNHKIIAYTLANDLTASGIEFEKSKQDYDPTYFGKVWKASCAVYSDFFDINEDIDIGLRIQRRDSVFDRTYNTSQRKRDFSDLAGMIIDYHNKFDKLPESKKILVKNGYLPCGTLILTGTGIITQPKWHAQEGDIVTVYSKFGELRNTVKHASHICKG